MEIAICGVSQSLPPKCTVLHFRMSSSQCLIHWCFSGNLFSPEGLFRLIQPFTPCQHVYHEALCNQTIIPINYHLMRTTVLHWTKGFIGTILIPFKQAQLLYHFIKKLKPREAKQIAQITQLVSKCQNQGLYRGLVHSATSMENHGALAQHPAGLLARLAGVHTPATRVHIHLHHRNFKERHYQLWTPRDALQRTKQTIL